MEGIKTSEQSLIFQDRMLKPSQERTRSDSIQRNQDRSIQETDRIDQGTTDPSSRHTIAVMMNEINKARYQTK